MMGAGSLAHNRRDFIAENVDADRTHLNVKYYDENLRKVYHELFDEAVERYNAVQKRNDRKITDYYEKIRQGKQEKLFHEMIIQIGNKDDMSSDTVEGEMAAKILDEYMKDFQQRNPTLRVFNCYLHMDEATPHLHIDFVPYISGWKQLCLTGVFVSWLKIRCFWLFEKMGKGRGKFENRKKEQPKKEQSVLKRLEIAKQNVAARRGQNKEQTKEMEYGKVGMNMEKHIYDENNGLTYTLHGDYYLPDLAVLEEETANYGKYGMLRKRYLKANKTWRYQMM